MIVQYKPNEKDQPILDDITANIRSSLDRWYGTGSNLDSDMPEIRSYRNSFILRYPVTTPGAQRKHILAKIRRNPKMDSLSRAIQADIHQNMENEYRTLNLLYDNFNSTEEDFGAIRPLAYLDQYPALVMEEYPARTLRQLLSGQRNSKTDWSSSELRDAARKTGQWLSTFHHKLYVPVQKPYTSRDILLEVQAYAERLELFSHGRVQAREVMSDFWKKLEGLPVATMTFSHSHSDMTIDNVLYSSDGRVCIIDVKNQVAPVYVDLGLILIHPETSKPQIFSMGSHFSENLLCKYRAEIVAGYFDEQPGDESLVRIYSAIQVLNKWLMYEELMSRYKKVKRLLAVPVAPYVSAYFKGLLKKHLDLVVHAAPGQTRSVERTTTSPPA